MSFAITLSRANLGINAPLVTVETHLSNGLPALNIVGLPQTAVRESKDRVRSAILNSQFDFPTSRITINLAPADLPKNGSRYDLAIALGILAASNQIPDQVLAEYEFAAELGLSGELKPISCILPLVLGTREANRKLILSTENLQEAELISNASLFPATHLLEVCAHLLDKAPLTTCISTKTKPMTTVSHDLREIQGQFHAKRALEIAAAGQHSILWVGPPGAGKTSLSHCLLDLLPALTEDEATELAAIQSLAGMKPSLENWLKRSFRSPHHSSSAVGLIGGGSPLVPGEISLAHHGVLFLDELPEFKRSSLESLREPIETGLISLVRARHKATFPARFQLICAMNPCPCGYYGSLTKNCSCSIERIKRYQSSVSGPLLDRIDLQIEIQPLASESFLESKPTGESSIEVAKRVLRARQIANQRTKKPNALLTPAEIQCHCSISLEDKIWLVKWLEQKHYSPRVYHKILKIARTIADIESSNQITTTHLKEAFSYRYFERLRLV